MDTRRGVPRAGGFTLVEMVIVIMVTGIIASVVGMFVSGPIRGFLDQVRRAALVDGAQQSLVRLGRDVRRALPNSVRVSGNALELLHTLDGDRYRTEVPGAADDRLDFTIADTAFNTLAVLDATGAAGTLRLAVYPLNQVGFNPYLDSVLTPATTAVTLAGPVVVGGVNESRIQLNPGHSFPFDSPSQRIYLVDGPVSYLCDGGQLLRYDGYAVLAAQPATRAALDALATPAVIAAPVLNCSLRYDPGTFQRNAVVTAGLQLGTAGENIRQIRQFHLDNTP